MMESSDFRNLDDPPDWIVMIYSSTRNLMRTIHGFDALRVLAGSKASANL